MTSSHRTSPAVLLFLALVVPVALATVVMLGDPLFAALGGAGKPVAITISLAGAAVCMALTVLHWKRLDEPARDAHRWAWFWGGGLGLGAGMLAATGLLALPGLAATFDDLLKAHSAQTHGRIPPTTLALFDGIGAVAIAAVVGHVGAWLYWWARRRSA